MHIKIIQKNQTITHENGFNCQYTVGYHERTQREKNATLSLQYHCNSVASRFSIVAIQYYCAKVHFLALLIHLHSHRPDY